MLKQSFTAENLRRILDYENRKGGNLEKRFFPDVAEINNKLKEIRDRIRSRKSELLKEEYKEVKRKYEEEKSDLRQERERILTEKLEQISSKISDKNFKIKIKTVSSTSEKIAYSIKNDDSASYFAIKQIQYNFRKLYKVKQSNRYDIIRQLTNVLNNNLPKYLIRTDIRRFYESIPRDKIFEKINADPLLTPVSKNIVRHILSEYERLSGNCIGIPRGIGISAYLSELHMRSFDETMINHPDVTYYARYVDDIVVVFSPKNELNTSKYMHFIKDEISKKEIGLELNDGKNGKNKTKQIDLLLPKDQYIEYLGYRINFGGKNESPILHMSQKKINRYKRRIDLAFKQQQI